VGVGLGDGEGVGVSHAGSNCALNPPLVPPGVRVARAVGAFGLNGVGVGVQNSVSSTLSPVAPEPRTEPASISATARKATASTTAITAEVREPLIVTPI
jgi:hypothetical protein